jgi:predicted transposase YbfD/YdcC
MENRVNTLETDLEILKRDMASCQASIRQDINHLRETRSELPQWLKNSAVGIILAIFSQTIASVWWASQISAGQNNMANQVEANTAFRLSWPEKHNEVMIKLTEISIDAKNMKEMLRDIKTKQGGHTDPLNKEQ